MKEDIKILTILLLNTYQKYGGIKQRGKIIKDETGFGFLIFKLLMSLYMMLCK